MYHPYSLRSSRPRFEATSPGERLWFAIRDWWGQKQAADAGALGWPSSDWLDERKRVGVAFAGAIVSDACVRLIRKARSALDECDLTAAPAEVYADYVGVRVKQYCISPMGISYADPILPVIANLAFASAVVSRQIISNQTRKNVRREALQRLGAVKCYLCDRTLAGDDTLDHLWPRAFGGVSDEDNLLSACEDCNTAKMDRIGWEVFGVVIDYAHLANAAGGSRQTNMALHRHAATRLAEDGAMTLKEAFIQLGPIRPRTLIDADERDDWFFNLAAHDLDVLPQLWN
jgi:hypothetical protein